ncbi:mitochondrial ribosomal protein S18B [Oratosquilla oratoria]|uniref:mitochondrial ribosomal protein S18B n=1 Tax=Oratosquilla oratoria TaxID=337810 RepID=UPI003F76890A
MSVILRRLQPIMAKSLGCHNIISPKVNAAHIAAVQKFGTSNVLQCSEETQEEAIEDPKLFKIIPVETSMKYMESDAYAETYKGQPVWVNYRRNFKGSFAPRKTRKMCIRQGKLATGNPCPICRDEYLVLDYRNIKLLQQFISPYNGEVLSYRKTNLCQRKHRELVVAVDRARDCGYLEYDVPLRLYDYLEYIPAQQES